jgi:hypothetical protein
MNTTGRRVLTGAALCGALYMLGVALPAHLKERAARAQAVREAMLREAIVKGDPEAVERIARERVNIYTIDATGETLLTLAEKSGNPRILAALGPYRDREKDLRRAQNAAETGTAIGLRPVRSEPEFDVHKTAKEESEKYQAGWGRPIEPAELAGKIQERIDALPEGERKEWALRNFATFLTTKNLQDKAHETAKRLKDPKMQVESLIYIAQSAQPPLLENMFWDARTSIDKLTTAPEKDPLYAQLAWIQNLRGRDAAARETCYMIQEPKFKEGTCARLTR